MLDRVGRAYKRADFDIITKAYDDHDVGVHKMLALGAWPSLIGFLADNPDVSATFKTVTSSVFSNHCCKYDKMC